jgi:uncharacterized damage-inducible protein DinB
MSTTWTSLLELFDFSSQRLFDRLQGLSEEEYFWKPTSSAWTIHEKAGLWGVDGEAQRGHEAPVTTIAWRLHHLSHLVYFGFAQWFEDRSNPYRASDVVPKSAREGVDLFHAYHERLRAALATFPHDELGTALGDMFGPFASSNGYDLALHVVDEHIHHAAEIALLRDLYRDRAEFGSKVTTA